MASMRSSTRYGGRKPTPKAAADSDEDERPVASSKERAPHSKPVPEQDMSDLEPESTEDLGAGRAFLPVTFGKQHKGPDEKNHDSQKRPEKKGSAAEKKTGVQFGHKAVDAATAAGARERSSRAETEKVSRPTGSADDSEEDEDLGPVPARDPDSDDEMMPLPGTEKKVLPVSHEVSIQAYEKAVTALGLDPKGSRMATGSMEGSLKFYDFNGMSEVKEAFRSMEPVEAHVIGAVSWGLTGGNVLVTCSDTHARIYDREGSSKPIQMTVKGDMYVRMAEHTKGHTQTITDGMWHPFQRDMFLTSSLDGTLRIWDTNGKLEGMDQQLSSLHVLKVLDKRNVCVGGGSGRDGGLHPLCCVYSPTDAKKIVAGCTDGSVQVFFDKARFQKPDRILRTAHSAPVTGVSFVAEGSESNIMVTRSMDNTMKVWDCRMLSDAKGPVKVLDDLPCYSERTNLCTSPDGKYIVTGTSFTKGSSSSASVRVYDSKGFELVKNLDFGGRGVTRITWHSELNQLIVGTLTGEVVMLYSPFSSTKGALHFVGKKAKSKPTSQEDASQGPIFCMTDTGDIKKFYATGHGNMQSIRKQETRKAQKTVTPARPPALQGGAAAASAEGSFAALALKLGAKRLNLNATRPGITEEDSQQALLKYQNKTEQASAVQTLVDRAYSKTQPTKLLDWSMEQSEGDVRMEAFQKGDFCRKCGMKNCRCVDYSLFGEKGKKPRTK